MTTGRRPDNSSSRWDARDVARGDARMGVEIDFRMTRLRAEAQREWLASIQARRSSVRLWLGRSLVALGLFVEGTDAGEQEYLGSVRA